MVDVKSVLVSAANRNVVLCGSLSGYKRWRLGTSSHRRIRTTGHWIFNYLRDVQVYRSI